MKIELDLLENSYDYLYTSLSNFRKADEYGNHDDQRSNKLDKQKWKISFVTLVQALELLLKQILFDIHPNLINQDIDNISDDVLKTVTIGQAISRVNAFSKSKISNEDVDFIINCAKLRNQFIHYKVSFTSQDMKKKYAALYHIYRDIHNTYIKGEIKTLSVNQKSWMIELDNFSKDMVIFRGGEYTPEAHKALLLEIKKNSEIDYYVDDKGNRYKRIKYGHEAEEVGEEYLKVHNIIGKTPNEYFGNRLTYCGACEAKIGEYHLYLCDIEICPKCYGQLIQCGCFPSRQFNEDI